MNKKTKVKEFFWELLRYYDIKIKNVSLVELLNSRIGLYLCAHEFGADRNRQENGSVSKHAGPWRYIP
jgi:hypothetical protein